MKVYDITLAFIRALVLLDLIREVTSMIPYGLRLAMLYRQPGYVEMRMVEAANFLTPLVGIVVSLLIFVFSKPLARFAAKFSGPQDAAAAFQ